MKHPFFIDVDWTAIAEKREKPSFRPVTKGGRDTSNIDKAFLAERPVDSPVNNQLTFSQQEKVYFEQFTYNRENDDFLLVDEDAKDDFKERGENSVEGKDYPLHE